jgi:hypothetical protein
VRAARQQDFLRQAKAQIGAKQIFDKRDKLARLVGRYTQTDKGLHDYDTVLNLLKLVAFSAGHPVREVQFPAIIPTDPKDTFLTYDQGKLNTAMSQFASGKSSRGPKESGVRKHRRKKSKTPQGLQRATQQGKQQAALAAAGTPFPVYYPKNMVIGGEYVSPPRVYRLRDIDGGKHRAYRMVVKLGQAGDYYGVQGMNWTKPPILDQSDGTKTVNGKSFQLYFDGARLRLVAWKNGNAVYWIANTLLRSLSNKQMLGIAGSLTRAS